MKLGIHLYEHKAHKNIEAENVRKNKHVLTGGKPLTYIKTHCKKEQLCLSRFFKTAWHTNAWLYYDSPFTPVNQIFGTLKNSTNFYCAKFQKHKK